MSSENRYLGAPILSLQVMLRVLAQAEGEVSGVIPDGIYGPETTRSVAAFQQKHGIEASGQADHATWNRIVDAFTRRSPLVLPADSAAAAMRRRASPSSPRSRASARRS